MRWNLIDKIDFLKKGHYATARKVFKGDEDFFADHFPGNPIVPGPLMLEMIAQAGGILFGLGIDFKKEIILAKISNAHILSELRPPCELFVKVTMNEQREEGALLSGVVTVGDVQVAKAQILLAAIEAFDGEAKSKIVFSDSFIRHFNIYEIAKRSEVLV